MVATVQSDLQGVQSTHLKSSLYDASVNTFLKTSGWKLEIEIK